MNAIKIRAKRGTREAINTNVARWHYERTLPGRAEKTARTLRLFNPPRWVKP